MLATLGGYLALLLGLTILLLPLLATELSRPRDAVWGAVVLLLGLVLVTSAERLNGAPMLGVLCAGLLIGRLGVEVGQGRWRMLSEEEQRRLWSIERWQTSLNQASAALGQLLTQAAQVSAGLGSWLAERRRSQPSTSKRWVRPEPPGQPDPEALAAESTAVAEPTAQPSAPVKPGAEPAADAPREEDSTVDSQASAIEVQSFDDIDALLEAAAPAADAASPDPPAASATEQQGMPDARSEAG